MNDSNLVFGLPTRRDLEMPEGYGALGPVELAPNQLALVPAESPEGESLYHHVQKNGNQWVLGPATNKRYVRKPKPRRTSKGTGARSTPSGKPAKSSGTTGADAESPASQPDPSED